MAWYGYGMVTVVVYLLVTSLAMAIVMVMVVVLEISEGGNGGEWRLNGGRSASKRRVTDRTIQ